MTLIGARTPRRFTDNPDDGTPAVILGPRFVPAWKGLGVLFIVLCELSQGFRGLGTLILDGDF